MSEQGETVNVTLEDIIKEMFPDLEAEERWWTKLGEVVARSAAKKLDHEMMAPGCDGCSACQPTIGRTVLRVEFQDAWDDRKA